MAVWFGSGVPFSLIFRFTDTGTRTTVDEIAEIVRVDSLFFLLADGFFRDDDGHFRGILRSGRLRFTLFC